MATRTPKAAKKAAGKPKAKAPASKPSNAPKGAKPKAAAKKARKAGGKPGLVFEETQSAGWPEALDTVRAKQPSFFERLRQRRAEKAEARALEAQRREAERLAAEQHRRQVEEEQRALREAQEREEAVQRAREERQMRAAAKRAEARAAKEAEREEAERRAAEEAAAKAAEEARQAEEKAAAAEAAKARRAAERQRKREELEAEERRLAEEQAARDAEAEVEARRLAVTARLKEEAEKAAAAAAAKEPEPDLEFEEASKPVKESDALVPAKGGATAADAQADLVAAELAKRRSKPIVVVGDLPEPPKLPKAPLRPGEQEVVLAPPEKREEPAPAASAQPSESFGFSLPEAFLLLANEGGWDERAERNREGAYGGALAGAMVLELLMHGQALVQRDRLVLTGEPTDDRALPPIVARLRRIREKKGDASSLQQMGELAKANRGLLEPFKQRLADKGLATYGSRKHLGLFHRSWVEVVDEGAQERLQNRLRRAIAGGGTPEAASILLLGLLDAAGLFATVVPDEAADYNRKRLNGLLGGRDIMGYKVDPELKALQEIAVRTVLSNVRVMTVRG